MTVMFFVDKFLKPILVLIFLIRSSATRLVLFNNMHHVNFFYMMPKQKELHYYIYLDKVINKELGPDELLSQSEQEKIIKAVAALSYPCNIILQDYYINGKPSREIIRQLCITKNKFYGYLHKGKFLLRQKLNGSFYDNANKILSGRR